MTLKPCPLHPTWKPVTSTHVDYMDDITCATTHCGFDECQLKADGYHDVEGLAIEASKEEWNTLVDALVAWKAEK